MQQEQGSQLNPDNIKSTPTDQLVQGFCEHWELWYLLESSLISAPDVLAVSYL